MKKIPIVLILSFLMLAACASGGESGETPVDQNDDPDPQFGKVQELTPVEEAVVKKVAGNLGLKESDVLVKRNEEMEFNDSCLGSNIQEEACSQVVTRGQRITVEAKGIQYEYHTSMDGARIQPVTVVLTWKREGGFVGFCDHMTIYLSGEVYRGPCAQGQYPEERLIDLLSADEFAQMNEWITTYGRIEIEASDPPDVSDRLIVVAIFSGVGSIQAMNVPDQQKMLDLAQDLYQRFSR